VSVELDQYSLQRFYQLRENRSIKQNNSLTLSRSDSEVTPEIFGSFVVVKLTFDVEKFSFILVPHTKKVLFSLFFFCFIRRISFVFTGVIASSFND
jgi:hypothetical protein